jgi:thiamine kinase-like enzyme
MKNIGKYHAELYKKISTKKTSLIGIKNDFSDFNRQISDILNKLKKISKNSKLYTNTIKMQRYYNMTKFVNPINSFLHGDLHKGNILINKSKLVGVIDFGKSIIGDIHKDFSHHMRHYPEYIDTIIKSYEINTGIKLSKDKIILYAFLKDMEKLIYHVDKYKTHKDKMEKKMDLYNNLFTNQFSITD